MKKLFLLYHTNSLLNYDLSSSTATCFTVCDTVYKRCSPLFQSQFWLSALKTTKHCCPYFISPMLRGLFITGIIDFTFFLFFCLVGTNTALLSGERLLEPICLFVDCWRRSATTLKTIYLTLYRFLSCCQSRPDLSKHGHRTSQGLFGLVRWWVGPLLPLHPTSAQYGWDLTSLGTRSMPWGLSSLLKSMHGLPGTPRLACYFG